ncbi:thiosulfate/3-mercaptopyruvate sulfurtransferase [Bradyrhizobium sp. AZCC 2262]|uniref:sulfurtransferase n=1 Tax=Bradyrhizobium sp. AZCC 2262 TaxID=3117022 RepID=UPI002FF42C3E
MAIDPVIEPDALRDLGPFRLLEAASLEGVGRADIARVPLEVWEAAAKSGETSFENIGYWERAIAALGIDGSLPAVVFDDGRLTEAARVWFILQYFGAQAFILNGGWAAIKDREDVRGVIPNSGTASFKARPGSGSAALVDRRTLKAELDADVRIFDARTAGEFAGEDLRRNSRGGHLPGARLLPHTNLLDASRLRSPNELRQLLTDAGFQSGDHIVTHCDGGGRAALAAAAALRAGYRDVRAYYLSFADWAKDESCAIVRD